MAGLQIEPKPRISSFSILNLIFLFFQATQFGAKAARSPTDTSPRLGVAGSMASFSIFAPPTPTGLPPQLNYSIPCGRVSCHSAQTNTHQRSPPWLAHSPRAAPQRALYTDAGAPRLPPTEARCSESKLPCYPGKVSEAINVKT